MNTNREIIRLAIPNILSNISIPLIASVDTGLMGHLSAAHLAAVGSASMIFNFLYWNFGFLRMGTTGMVAQAYGEKNQRKSGHILIQACIVALLLAACIILFQQLSGTLAMSLMNLEGEVASLGMEYYNIRIWDAPATLLLYVAMGWFFGNQNAVIPLIVTLVINLSNIALSFYFVRYLDWSISGVAWGSVLANYLGLLVAGIWIVRKYAIDWSAWKQWRNQLGRFFQVNANIFLRTLMLSCTFAFLYSQAASYGPVVLGINVIILQFTNWMSYAIDGFAYASEALVGKHVGAKEHKLVFKTIKISFIYASVLAGLFALIYGIFPLEISRLFTNQSVVLDQILDYRWCFIAFPILGFASYIWDGVFIGLTASKAMRNTMFVAFVSFILSYYILKPSYAYHGLLLAFAIYLLVRGIAQTWVFYKRRLELN